MPVIETESLGDERVRLLFAPRRLERTGSRPFDFGAFQSAHTAVNVTHIDIASVPFENGFSGGIAFGRIEGRLGRAETESAKLAVTNQIGPARLGDPAYVYFGGWGGAATVLDQVHIGSVRTHIHGTLL